MAKFYGPVGFVNTTETKPGVWENVVTERNLCGDELANIRRSEPGENVIDGILLNNKLSIVADPYALEHFFAIRYVKWKGAYWSVTNVETLRPRLILTIGGVYNGPTAPVA